MRTLFFAGWVAQGVSSCEITNCTASVVLVADSFGAFPLGLVECLMSHRIYHLLEHAPNTIQITLEMDLVKAEYLFDNLTATELEGVNFEMLEGDWVKFTLPSPSYTWKIVSSAIPSIYTYRQISINEVNRILLKYYQKTILKVMVLRP